MKYVTLLLVVSVCSTAWSSPPVTVVAFNAENLFDTNDDPDNPRDNTYLPLALKDQDRPTHDALCEAHNSGFYLEQCKTLDWSNAVYTAKLQRYADVLKAMPQLPTVVVIPETENKQVLLDLVGDHLPGSGYEVIQLDTSDEPESRGIDVGMLTQLPVVGTPQAHPIDFKGDSELCGKTRDILQVTLELPDSEEITVFGVHFPSGRSPIRCRYRAMKNLNTLVASLPADSLVIAAGDFNINCNEAPTDAVGRLFFRGNWYVSPEIRSGCDAPGSSKFRDGLLDTWHTWSFLDMILVSKELSPSQPSEKNWFADLGSFQTLVVHPEQIAVDESDKGFIEPQRFDPVTLRGVSDHWPVGLRLLQRRVD